MKSNEQLDDMRQKIQESLVKSKRDVLRDQFGMHTEYTDSNLPFEVESQFLDHMLEFERQFETAKTITVREKIGDPSITPLSELSLYAVDEAIEEFLELLAEFWIAVDFLGDWEETAVYTYLTGEFLDEEISDMQIEEMWSVFTPSTPEYDIQMWVEDFVMDLFIQERKYFLSSFDKQPLFDIDGEPITAVQFCNQIEEVWQHLPITNKRSVEPITVQVEDDEGEITAVISWRNDEDEPLGQVESYFHLQPSPYTGWDIVQTSLLDDLLQFFEA